MRVSIFGSGYVGLITGACLAEVGNQVLCVDIDEARVENLNRGVVPIYEPGLEDLLHANQSAGRLHFTTDALHAIDRAEVLFIAVGTPPTEDGSADLNHVLSVARTIGRHLMREAVVVVKSTVPVGTAHRVRDAIGAELAIRGGAIPFDVISNPEFLKEGGAIEDCMRPARIVVGSTRAASIELMRQLYAPFNRSRDRVVVMDERSAELTKYAANAMLATKISLMNELANIAERVGADIEMVRRGIGSDPRIGHHFIYAGAGFGGSCFPKDLQALERTAACNDYEARILRAVEAVNQRQKSKLYELAAQHFGNQISGKTFAMWGLAFKPDTDDIREASSCALLEQLWRAGASVRAYDPAAMDEIRRVFGNRPDLQLCDRALSALESSDALMVLTEWKAFLSPDFDTIRATLRTPVIFDGRNLYDPEQVESAGIAYYGIGRGRSSFAGAGRPVSMQG